MMFAPTWTIDDIAPLGLYETSKAAGRWLVRASVRVLSQFGHVVIRDIAGGLKQARLWAQRSVKGAHSLLRSASVRMGLSPFGTPVRARSFNPGAEAPRLSAEPSLHQLVEAHWKRCATIISGSIERARLTERHQLAALQQIDLAQYGLSSLKIELSSVMQVPGFDGPAKLHRLPNRQVLRPVAVHASAAA